MMISNTSAMQATLSGFPAPQSMTHASGPHTFVMPSGLQGSSSSGSLPKIPSSEQAKVYSFNTSQHNSTGLNVGAVAGGAMPANKENNTKKQLAGEGHGHHHSVSVSYGANGGRASSGGTVGQLNYHHANKPGLMQHHA